MNNEEKTEMKQEVDQVVDTKASESKMSFMENVVKQMDDKNKSEIREGKSYKCVVLKKESDGLIVACGQKKEGFISIDEIASQEEFDSINVDDVFNATMIKAKDKSEYLALSKKLYDNKANAKRNKEEAEKALAAGDFEVTVVSANKGGLQAKLFDTPVFIPNSQIMRIQPAPENAQKLEDEKAKLVGKTIKVRKLPEKENSKNKSIVASRKLILIEEHKDEMEKRRKEKEERKQREIEEKKLIFAANRDRFEVDFQVPGIVRRHAKCGAFVDVYGFTCLVPTKDISWSKDIDPTTVLEVNKEYEFIITKIYEDKDDPELYRVNLSYKKLLPKPYEQAQIKYPVGTIVEGKVQSITNFGAFVSLEPGIDGLVHISNISYDKIENVEDVLKKGQVITAKVIAFEEKGIALSMKALLARPESQRAPRPERGENEKGGKKFDANKGEKKPAKKNEDAYESQEEKDNFASYGASEKATNLAFADIFKTLNVDSEEENKKPEEDGDK